MITTPGSTASFVKAWRGRSLTHKTVALRAFSVADANQLSHALGPVGEGVGLSQVVPYPYDARRSPVAQAYVDASARTTKPVTFLGLEGFIAARALLEVLRTVDARPTRARLVEALRAQPRLDLGGFPLAFGPKQNAGSSFVEVVALRGPQGFMR
jgi:ABC-type branched-subunit amino acid transport system substrate-binding protein